MKETLKVDSLSMYGFKVGTEYVNWSKKITDADKAKVVPGVTLEADLFVSDSGKKYLNAVLKTLDLGATTPTAAKFTPTEKKAYAPKTVAKAVAATVGRDFDKEARGKSRFGFFTAAVQSPFVATMNSQEEVINFAKAVADAGMADLFPDGVK